MTQVLRGLTDSITSSKTYENPAASSVGYSGGPPLAVRSVLAAAARTAITSSTPDLSRPAPLGSAPILPDAAHAKISALRVASPFILELSQYKTVSTTKFLGRVLSVTDDLFTAELNRDDMPADSVLADFDLSEADAEDVAPGDTFYLTLSRHVHRKFGTKRATSSIRFRRLGYWSIADAEQIYAAASSASDALNDYVDP